MLLIIGNKRYSSWSMRPWLLLRHFAIPFEEKLIALDQPATTKEILAYSPSARVPALVDGELRLWESLAIAEYLHERFPEKGLWPTSPQARAVARAVSSEMHAGFGALRQHLPMDLQMTPGKLPRDFDRAPATADIARVQELWRDCLAKSGGPFLFGEVSIADAMFAPVVSRFVSYGVPVDADLNPYLSAIRAWPAYRDWFDAAQTEPLHMPRYER